MNKLPVSFLGSLLLCTTLHAILDNSYVWVRNNSPASWSIEFDKYDRREGDALEKGKYWSIGKTYLGPWDAGTNKKDVAFRFANEDGIHSWVFKLRGVIDNVKLPERYLRVGSIDKKVFGLIKGDDMASTSVNEKEKETEVATWGIDKRKVKGLKRDRSFIFRAEIDGDDFYFDIYDSNPNVFPSTKGDKDRINVVAYNVYFINAPTVGKGRDKRAKLIPVRLKDADVVIFCEVFDDGSREILLEGMRKYGFKYSTAILGSAFEEKGHKDEMRNQPLVQPFVVDLQSSKFQHDKKYRRAGEGEHGIGIMDGGVIIVSKHPFAKTVEWVYEKGVSWDAKAHKGALYALVNKDGKFYHIFGTHPQAPYGAGGQGEDLKQKTLDKILSQYKSLRKFIESQDIPENQPVIVGGDFNIDTYASTKPGSFKKLLNILNARKPKNIGFPYSADRTGTLGREKDSPRQLLDHVVYIKDYQVPKKSFNEVLIFRTLKPWDDDHFDLSDHNAVLGYFKF